MNTKPKPAKDRRKKRGVQNGFPRHFWLPAHHGIICTPLIITFYLKKKKKKWRGTLVVVCPKWNIACEAVSAGSFSRSSKSFTVVLRKKKKKKKKTIKKKRKKKNPSHPTALVCSFPVSPTHRFCLSHTNKLYLEPLPLWSKQKVVSKWGDSTTCEGFSPAVDLCDWDHADKGRPHFQDGKRAVTRSKNRNLIQPMNTTLFCSARMLLFLRNQTVFSDRYHHGRWEPDIQEGEARFKQ